MFLFYFHLHICYHFVLGKKLFLEKSLQFLYLLVFHIIHNLQLMNIIFRRAKLCIHNNLLLRFLIFYLFLLKLQLRFKLFDLLSLIIYSLLLVTRGRIILILALGPVLLFIILGVIQPDAAHFDFGTPTQDIINVI